MMGQKTGEGFAGTSFRSQTVGSSRSRAVFSGVMARICVLALAFATLGLALHPVPLMAKRRKPPTSKTVVGQVFNASGNGIAGAAVEMKDLTTGKTLAIYTGPQGHFQFTDLKLTQDYQFRAHYKGQLSELRKVSSWDTRTNLVINLHIPPPKD